MRPPLRTRLPSPCRAPPPPAPARWQPAAGRPISVQAKSCCFPSLVAPGLPPTGGQPAAHQLLGSYLQCASRYRSNLMSTILLQMADEPVPDSQAAFDAEDASTSALADALAAVGDRWTLLVG